ncbi:MAG: cytochrome c biogenesis protein CcsA, partial [Pseudomonadota bacterium]
DARLTSMLILFFIYLGFLALSAAYDHPSQAQRPCAIFALIGAINLPIIKFSVDWWSTLHQPASILRRGGPAIDPQFLWPLAIMGAGFLLLFIALTLTRIKIELIRAKLASLDMLQNQYKK